MVQRTNGLLFLQHGPHSLLIFWFCPEIIVLGYDDGLFLSPCHAILHILLAFSIANLTWKRYFYPLHNRTNYKWVSFFRTLDCERHKSTILCDVKFNKCSIPINSVTQQNISADTWMLEVSYMWTWITHKIRPKYYLQMFL